ncbi:MAG: hypothetical protein DMF57_03760 [Acidobacteria bacterium]|nr:MAG: hypothetical protein DMF57_03760 [Acidobacteriota bacterium]
MDTPRRHDHLRKTALVVAACAAWIYSAVHFFVSGIRQPLHNFNGDFLASFPSWRLSVLLGRLDLYCGSLAEDWAVAFRSGIPVWHYGPVAHLVTLPLFAFGNLRSAYLAWLVATYAFLLVSLVLAARAFDLRGVRWIALLAILNFVPLYEALTQRNIEIFEVALILAAFVLMRAERQSAAGIVIGFAAMTKFLPLIFIPYFAVKRMWNALAASLITVVSIAVAAELVFGWRNSGTVIQLLRGSFLSSALNQSLSGMIIRLLRWTHSSLSVAMLSRVAIVAGLAGLSWIFLKTRRRAGIEDLEWGTLIVAMVLLPPHNEQYYFVMLLFPFLALLARRLYLSWLAISFLLVGAPVPFRLLGPGAFSIYLQAGIPFIGAAILAVLCVRAVRHVPCS